LLPSIHPSLSRGVSVRVREEESIFFSRDKLCVAQIGAAHGIRGEVRLKAFTADPMAVAQYGALTTEDARQFEIASLRAVKDDVLVARLKGIDDRTAAEALRNRRLFIPRERLAAPDADEFYHADLLGLPVVDAQGHKLGTVAAVPNFGGGDLLEIAPIEGGPSVLLPFTKAIVPEIDIVGRRIVINPPEGSFS
jgi:16S rRNA processing protein RimM